MIYKDTKSNFLEFIEYNPAIRKDQLCIFFSEEIEPSKAVTMADDLILSGDIIYDEDLECYIKKFGPIKKHHFLKRYIYAFWPIAWMGSNEVEFIYPAKYPIGYFFKTESNGIFTSTYCKDTEDARVASLVRETMCYKGIEDDFNHIAVFKDLELIPDLKRYGFDTLALFNEKDKSIKWIQD